MSIGKKLKMVAGGLIPACGLLALGGGMLGWGAYTNVMGVDYACGTSRCVAYAEPGQVMMVGAAIAVLGIVGAILNFAARK